MRKAINALNYKLLVLVEYNGSGNLFSLLSDLIAEMVNSHYESLTLILLCRSVTNEYYNASHDSLSGEVYKRNFAIHIQYVLCTFSMVCFLSHW